MILTGSVTLARKGRHFEVELRYKLILCPKTFKSRKKSHFKKLYKVYGLCYFVRCHTYRVSQEQLYFLKAHCSHQNDSISKISSLLSRQLTEFYVDFIYGNIN